MKALIAPITVVVIIVGAYFGYQDFQKSKNGTQREQQNQNNPDSNSENQNQVTNGDQNNESDPDDPQQNSVSTIDPVDPEAINPRVESALEEHESLCKAGKLEEARQLVQQTFESLLNEHGEAFKAHPADLKLLAPLRRVKLSQDVFDSILEIDPLGALPETLYSVQLENGQEMIAQKASLVGEKYEITLFPNAISFSRKASDIQNVNPIPKASYQKTEWKKLLTRLKEKAKDPIDLYIKGVGKSLKLGLEKEAYLLLQKVLNSSDPDSVLEIVFSEQDDTFRSQWRQASGKESLAAIPGISPNEATDESTATTIATNNQENPHQEPDDPPREQVKPPPVQISASELQGELAKIRELRESARKIYKRVIEGGDAKQLDKARKDLENARSILSQLPQDSDLVKRTKAEVYQLLHAVIKAQPL